MLEIYVSQVQFSRSWSQDFGTHDRKSQVQGFQFQGPVKVSGLRVFRFRVSGPDFRLCRFACIKSLNRYNLRHNSCVIFSIFLCFKYSFLSNSFIYKFIHSIIFLLIERKATSYLSVELSKIYQYWSCLIIL